MKPYTYVIIREDISPAQQIVQGCHAALQAGFAFDEPEETSSLIVCTVPDKASLEEAAERLIRKGIAHKMFFEPDFHMGHSAICTRPLLTKKERFLMKKYPLFVGASFQDAPAVKPNVGPRALELMKMESDRHESADLKTHFERPNTPKEGATK